MGLLCIPSNVAQKEHIAGSAIVNEFKLIGARVVAILSLIIFTAILLAYLITDLNSAWKAYETLAHIRRG